MRRLASIAAFGLFLAVPLWAQHGGGHAGGGHAGGGFSGGGHAAFGGGHASGGHFSGGMHSNPGFSRGMSQRGFSSRGFSNPGFSTRSFRSRGPIITNFGFHRFNRFGRGLRRWGFGYPAWGYYDPYWWWDSGSNYDVDYERDRDYAEQMNQQSLEEQRMLRQEEADGDQDAYARPSRSASNRNNIDDPPGASIMPATVLVFRDQHKQEVQNYAIVGQTLWSFSPHTQRIPLADLDLTATAEANDDQGISFRIPVSNKAQ